MVQKQPPEKSFEKRCSKKSCKSYRKTPVLCNFIEIALRHGCSPVNLLHIFRTSFLKNTSQGLFLSGTGVFLWICDFFKNIFFIEYALLKLSYFLFFFPFFSSFGNYWLNWKCEYMKLNSWKRLQISWCFLTFTWSNEYYEWGDHYMNLFAMTTKVYSIFEFVVGEKEKVF